MTYEHVLTALADPTRRTLFESVAAQPTSVGDLAKSLPISRPAVSQHLKVLEQAQLVTATPQGNRRIYALNPAGLDNVRRYLDRFWTDALGAYAAEVQRHTIPN
jgi:DNA-binding transcriptional ArsR family regulator